jgi:hypothetical protein
VFGVDFILAYFLFYYVIGNELVNEICLRVFIKKKIKGYMSVFRNSTLLPTAFSLKREKKNLVFSYHKASNRTTYPHNRAECMRQSKGLQKERQIG